MKTLLTSFLVFAALLQPATSGLTVRASGSSTVNWDDVEAYFDGHATYRDPITEALLRNEAESGVKTWITFTETSGDSGRNISVTRPLDGPGLGWPGASLVVRFATMAETNTAAGLIDGVTLGGSVRTSPKVVPSVRPGLKRAQSQ